MTFTELMQTADKKGLRVLIRNTTEGDGFLHIFKKETPNGLPDTVLMLEHVDYEVLWDIAEDEVINYSRVPFPKIMKAENGLTVLFTEEKVGVVLACTNNDWRVGTKISAGAPYCFHDVTFTTEFIDA